MNCTCEEKLTINTIFKYDPTRTSTIRNRWIKDFTRRFVTLNKVVDKAIIDDDILQIESSFGSIQRLTANAPSDRLKLFQLWLSDQHDKYLLSAGKEGIRTIRRPGTIQGIETQWTDVYIESGYQKGILRSRQELKKIGLEAQATELNLSGFSATLNQPFHADRLGLLFTQGFDLVKNVSDDLKSKLTRTVALGMAEGRSPREIIKMFGEGTLKGLHKDASKALIRAKAIARTEVIRAHHTANIAEYERMGIEDVEVVVEWSTAGFNVCPLCQPLEGKIFSLDAIKGQIPRHPNCRCVAIPILKEDIKNKRIKRKVPVA